jgi:transposase InsO family protein
MLIFNHYSKVMNKKKIARLKRENGLITQIRKKRNYIKFLKLKQEHKVAPNHLNREFKRDKADEVYSTDITQLNYGSGKKAYLAVFKDLATKEVIASNLSNKIDIKLVNEALGKAIKGLSSNQRKALMIHSDQGFHFTHFYYRQLLEKNGITQSMSRKGNCIDNAPIESFFGYIKDHLDLNSCKNLTELRSSVTKEIDYYNYRRPQWDLKKMPPKQYRRHLTSLAQGLF